MFKEESKKRNFKSYIFSCKISKKYFLFLACLLCIFSIPVTAKEKPQPKKIILNRREILLYVGEAKKLSVGSYRKALKSSPLAAYRNMNFDKETLVLVETYRKEKETITSCRTKLDADGKLQAIITFPYKKRDPSFPPLPPTLTSSRLTHYKRQLSFSAELPLYISCE